MATILVVDDDRAIRDVVCFALTRAGFEVQQAADGAAALRQFRAAPADLIVLGRADAGIGWHRCVPHAAADQQRADPVPLVQGR